MRVGASVNSYPPSCISVQSDVTINDDYVAVIVYTTNPVLHFCVPFLFRLVVRGETKPPHVARGMPGSISVNKRIGTQMSSVQRVLHSMWTHSSLHRFTTVVEKRMIMRANKYIQPLDQMERICCTEGSYYNEPNDESGPAKEKQV